MGRWNYPPTVPTKCLHSLTSSIVMWNWILSYSVTLDRRNSVNYDSLKLSNTKKTAKLEHLEFLQLSREQISAYNAYQRGWVELHFSFKDITSGAIWKPLIVILVTGNTFDVVDIQRLWQTGMQKNTCASKSLKVRSRIDFFLVEKKVLQYAKKSKIHPSIAPDKHAIYLFI